MGAHLLNEVIFILVLAMVLSKFLDFMFQKEQRRNQSDILSGIRDRLRGIEVRDFARLTAESVDRVYDQILGPRLVSARGVGVAALFGIGTTLGVYLAFDGAPLQRLTGTHMWIILVLIMAANTLVAMPSIVATRFFLKRVVVARSRMRVAVFLVADAVSTYALVTVAVFLIAIFILPVVSAVLGAKAFSWPLVGTFASFEPVNALAWLRDSPNRIDGVGSDWYATTALLPAFLWSWLTAGALAAYGTGVLLQATGIRVASSMLASEKTALALLALFLAGIIAVLGAWAALLGP